jgi:hypothetical protein
MVEMTGSAGGADATVRNSLRRKLSEPRQRLSSAEKAEQDWLQELQSSYSSNLMRKLTLLRRLYFPYLLGN